MFEKIENRISLKLDHLNIRTFNNSFKPLIVWRLLLLLLMTKFKTRLNKTKIKNVFVKRALTDLASC